jgi:murein DD-endopeptidase MepM/ murein hydrolase activator NlpD
MLIERAAGQGRGEAVQQPAKGGSEKQILLIKSAYWVALLIIAAMAMASYVLLQQMMSAQQRDEALLSLVSTQKALSQRVVFLANAADRDSLADKPGLIASLKKATAEFEKNYDQLLDETNADPASPARNQPDTLENVLFAKPFHLDYFSMGLAANGWRFISAVETDLGTGKAGTGYLAGKERAQLDETVANATLTGYAALGERIETMAAVNDEYAYVNVAPPEAAPRPARPAEDEEEEDDGSGLRFYNAFYETALRQQIPREIIDELVRVFSNDVDMQRRASPSDSFEAFFTDDDGELDLMHASLTVGGESFKYYRYANPEENFADYYNEQGKSARKFLLRKPIAEGVFRSSFGMRFHPILRYSRLHSGVDWANKVGTPILAAGNGKVVKAQWDSGYGRRVEIEHANGYVTTYSHMSGFARGISDGARVRQGQVIGYVGTTGLSTGPHLHYEVVVNGSFVDPMRIKVPRGRELEGRALAEFSRHREQVDGLLQKAPGAAPRLAQSGR